MAKPIAVVDFSKCRPAECGKEGACPALKECKHRALTQEARGEPPYPFGLCQGCAVCVTACPLGAIQII